MVTIRFEERLLASPIDPDWKVHREGSMLIVQVEPFFSISDALQLGSLQFSQPVAALINGVSADLNQKLQEGDEVRLLPLIAGGKL